MKRRKFLEARLREIAARSQEITAAAAARAEGEQALTDEEQAEIEALSSEFDTLRSELGSLLAADRIQSQITEALPRRTQPDPQPGGAGAGDDDAALPRRVGGGQPRAEEDPARGFTTFGAFCAAVYRARVQPSTIDERLLPLAGDFQAAASGNAANIQVGADGAFMIPPVWTAEIREHMEEDEAILPRTDNIELTQGNSLTFPADETLPWGTDGVRAYWAAESAAATKTKPALKERTLRMHKLLGLVAVTDELLEDAVALGQFLMPRLGRSIRFKTNDAFVNGTGAGQPLGILNAAALVTVAKEGSQAADTILVENVAKMWARMPAASLNRAVWHLNPDAMPQLITMVISGNPIWTPPSTGVTGAPSGMLLGRPIIPLQSCKTVGDKGDIYFVDWSGYVTLTKASGVKMATSIHLYFDAEETAFRASYRVDGQPWLTSSITPLNGSNNLSPFVTLAERA